MTNNKDILGLGPLMPDPRFTPDPTFLISGEGDALSHDFSTIGEGMLRQKMVMDGIKTKVHHAFDCTAELCQYANQCFNDTSLAIALANKAMQGECNTQYVDPFSLRIIQQTARYLRTLLEVGTFKITQEVYRPLLPPPEPPQSFIKKLFG